MGEDASFPGLRGEERRSSRTAQGAGGIVGADGCLGDRVRTVPAGPFDGPHAVVGSRVQIAVRTCVGDHHHPVPCASGECAHAFQPHLASAERLSRHERGDGVALRRPIRSDSLATEGIHARGVDPAILPADDEGVVGGAVDQLLGGEDGHPHLGRVRVVHIESIARSGSPSRDRIGSHG